MKTSTRITIVGMFACLGLAMPTVTAQAGLLSIEFNEDDQADFDVWPAAMQGLSSSTAQFSTDPGTTSGTTTVTITTTTSLSVPTNRGSSNGNPAGYTYQHLYEDLLHASSPTGALTLSFAGLNPNQSYRFTLYAWDPGNSADTDRVWTITEGTGVPGAASVNWSDPLVDNETFAMVFDITTTGTGTFQVVNTAGLAGSAVSGFKLAPGNVVSGEEPAIHSPPQGATVMTGDAVVLEVGAGGPGPLSYQWLRDGELLPEETSDRLVLDAAAWADGGEYVVWVTNPHGTTPSAPVAVNVTFPTREELTYEAPGPASRRSGVAISEILYHPAQRSDGRELEFVELHNSLPWRQDVSGWRLGGDIDFTFPEGTSVPPRGYLLAARIPANVASEYGISGVAGPWSGNLPNQGGRIRLRKASGAIVQEVNYDDRDPWPLAADGTGHSLVLARPSYGEDDPRAWEPSHHIGGSPGVADPVPSGDLDHVFVSAALSNSDAPLEDYIELRNGAPFPVDLSGCTLSDARDSLARFTIPTTTTIPAHGTLRFMEAHLGFALDAQGDAVYLADPGGERVLDAVRLPPAATDIPFARARGDAPLRAMATPRVVINEIMFHPPTHDDADEWIEIMNTGDEGRDLGGWAFTDGITFALPAGTRIPAGGFLVIARDRARTLANHPGIDPAIVLGDFEGSLSDAGERVELSRPENGTLVAEDAVTYADSNRWHRFADGRGATLERIDPGGDSSATSNWADSDESAKAGWTNVEFTGTLAHGNPSAPANQVQMFLLGPGEALVDEVEVIPHGGSNLVSNGGFESGVSGWFFQGNHRRSVLEAGDAFDGNNSLRLVATRRGDPGPNRARAVLGQTLATGSRATLRARVRWLAGHPEFLMRLKGNWLEAAGRLDLPSNLGTPGAANGNAAANTGPQIDLVTHRPVLPQAGAPFRVFAQVADPDGLGSVTLRYRIDPGSRFTGLPMRDDGQGADLSPSDGIFSATIPALAAGTLVAFQVRAEDAMAVPAASVFPPDGECLARVGDPAAGPLFGNYRIWITEAAVDDWDTQPFRSNDPFPVTFIYNDTRPVYAAGAYYSGNKDSHGDPLSGSVGFDVQLPAGDEVLGAGKLTLDRPVRDPTNQREQLMHWFADQLRLPTLHRRDVYLYTNGTRRLTIYHDAEQPDGVVVNSHFPGNEGELFKTSNDNETTDAGVRIRPFVRPVLDVFLADRKVRAARYRWTTAARARGSRTRLDDTSIVELMQRADDQSSNYEARLLETIDMENWMRTFAMNDLSSFWDSFGNPNWKNTYLHKPDGGKWVQFTWDFDVGLGVFNDPPNAALFPSGVDANIQRMFQTPAFVRSYWRAMDESLGTFFSAAGVRSVLAAKRTAYETAGLGFTSPFSPSGAYNLSIPDWIEQRAAFIRPQLDAVNVPFNLAGPGNGSFSSERTISLSGTAPVNVASIEVNGIELDLAWTSVSGWSAPFVLQGGANHLTVRARGPDGTELASETRTVTYTGPDGWPPVVINEWMASNPATLADPADGDFDDWIELANPGSTPVDLAGWFLSDNPADPFKFQIPNGFGIPGGGFLLAWADDETMQNNPASRPDLHLPFRLDAGGESILLSAPDGTLIDRVDFGPQSPDKTMGRAEGRITALAVPSPHAANGRAAVDPHVSVSENGNTLRFTVLAEPGFIYAAEASNDLLTWELLDTATAAGSTVEFATTTEQPARFLRFARQP